jgi:hypothetical protein
MDWIRTWKKIDVRKNMQYQLTAQRGQYF